jgi:hypothetical protein
MKKGKRTQKKESHDQVGATGPAHTRAGVCGARSAPTWSAYRNCPDRALGSIRHGLHNFFTGGRMYPLKEEGPATWWCPVSTCWRWHQSKQNGVMMSPKWAHPVKLPWVLGRSCKPYYTWHTYMRFSGDSIRAPTQGLAMAIATFLDSGSHGRTQISKRTSLELGLQMSTGGPEGTHAYWTNSSAACFFF